MLRFLRIKHLATIDAVEVEFVPGLNVLTGETGAGKSILVEAVGLLLGSRAAGDLVRTGEEAAAVEAIVEDEHGAEILLRREVTSQGRSRAFIDGALVTAGALRERTARLIEIHGQHEHQTLLDPETHVALVDAFGGLAASVSAVASAFGEWRVSVDELTRLRTAIAERSARQELAAFQLGELERAALQAGEDESLLETRQVLASAERIERLCGESYQALYERDDAALAALGGVWRRVGELASLDRQFQPYLDARDAIKSQLEELAFFLRRYADSVDASPARLQQVEERLALIERLKKKYGPSLDAAIARRDALRAELSHLASADEQIEVVEKQLGDRRRGYLAAAEQLSLARRQASDSFSRDLERLLAELAMEHTRFEVRFADPAGEDQWTSRGIDRAECYISPNIGEELRPLARIASGGELSRIMLAIKTLTSTTERTGLPAVRSLIFDEVDAGIGGRVADVVGRKLRALGSASQVLCITHLPQIAASAHEHFVIEKAVERGRTRTTVAHLDEDGRVRELGRMLGGARVTDAIRASAQEMLRERQKDEGRKAKAKGERAKAKPNIRDDNRQQRNADS